MALSPRSSFGERKGAACQPSPRSAGASPALVFETLFAYQRTAALRAAIELGVFGAVGDGAGDVAALARHCGASERGMRILCDFLTVVGSW